MAGKTVSIKFGQDLRDFVIGAGVSKLRRIFDSSIMNGRGMQSFSSILSTALGLAWDSIVYGVMNAETMNGDTNRMASAYTLRYSEVTAALLGGSAKPVSMFARSFPSKFGTRFNKPVLSLSEMMTASAVFGVNCAQFSREHNKAKKTYTTVYTVNYDMGGLNSFATRRLVASYKPKTREGKRKAKRLGAFSYNIAKHNVDKFPNSVSMFDAKVPILVRNVSIMAANYVKQMLDPQTYGDFVAKDISNFMSKMAKSSSGRARSARSATTSKAVAKLGLKRGR